MPIWFRLQKKGRAAKSSTAKRFAMDGVMFGGSAGG